MNLPAGLLQQQQRARHAKLDVIRVSGDGDRGGHGQRLRSVRVTLVRVAIGGVVGGKQDLVRPHRVREAGQRHVSIGRQGVEKRLPRARRRTPARIGAPVEIAVLADVPEFSAVLLRDQLQIRLVPRVEDFLQLRPVQIAQPQCGVGVAAGAAGAAAILSDKDEIVIDEEDDEIILLEDEEEIVAEKKTEEKKETSTAPADEIIIEDDDVLGVFDDDDDEDFLIVEEEMVDRKK